MQSWVLQSSQVKRAVIDSINELIIWKKKLIRKSVLQPVSNSNLHSYKHNEQWIFCDNLSVFVQIENLWIDKIAPKTFTDVPVIKFKETELVWIS